MGSDGAVRKICGFESNTKTVGEEENFLKQDIPRS